MEFESLHLGMYDGFTGLFYPESEEIKEKKRTKEKSGTKILAVAGFPILFGMKMEIMDLSNPKFTCKNPPNFPYSTKFAIGGMISNDILYIEGDMPTLPAAKFGNPSYKLKKFKGRLFEEWRWERILPPSGTKYFMGSGSSIVLKKRVT